MILFLIPLGIIAFFLFTIFQVYGAFLGFDFYFGSMWATIAIVLSIIFRFPLPISIAAFFGAVNVWHWPWFLAALFISPGLLLLIPGILVLLVARMKLDPFFKDAFRFKKSRFKKRSGNYSNVENSQPEAKENLSKNTIIDAEYFDITTQEKKK
jgi:Sec-independent protein translocase protein TatA